MIDKPTPTGRELEILKILWEDGASSVRSVYHRLAAAQEEDLAYNTVQKRCCGWMEDKALVSHHVEGRISLSTRPSSAVRTAWPASLERVFDGGRPRDGSELAPGGGKIYRPEELDRLHAFGSPRHAEIPQTSC